MESCEICGKNTEKIYLARIEEANMWVCESCSRGKKIIKSVNLEKGSNSPAPKIGVGADEEEVVEHYGEQIRKAREKLGLPVRVLAERIAEKESTLERIEKEKGLPTDKLRKKIEKELGIKLTSKLQGENITGGLERNRPITLGDAAFTKEQIEKGEE
ncbi:MAG: TIGR00270 family protein [Candidatus Micrarchaeota archaeon]|nr:TIGR00270 family protein [Candidatus Micrarchaeota archaeon]MDE1847823.1 TIGR00270 family protein [Candidatus Micrarchaeota archaeon]MDE1864371.1 TIGR00270 family protein [Candidatus Micrarchaeota archaeon]